MRSIPGRDGVPLKYICRDNQNPDNTPNDDFLDDYIAMAPLEGKAYTTDAQEVHTYIVNFIAGNDTAEAKILPHVDENDGSKDYVALRNHYEGVGINAIDITKADKVLDTLFYAGEKKPHMWWEEFEKQLNNAFTTYDRKEKREVHSDPMKLRILVKKVQADFLQHTKASIMLDLNKDPITLTYEQALASF